MVIYYRRVEEEPENSILDSHPSLVYWKFLKVFIAVNQTCESLIWRDPTTLAVTNLSEWK